MDSKIYDIESLIAEEGFYVFKGEGGSMWPFIREGVDTVGVSRISGKLSRGEVILYRDKGGRYVLHRILEIRDDGSLVTRGDNCTLKEEVPAERVIAVMTSLWRGEKQVRLQSLSCRLYTSLVLHHPLLFRLCRRLLRH